jgi:hypothetical protein
MIMIRPRTGVRSTIQRPAFNAITQLLPAVMGKSDQLLVICGLETEL